MTKPTQAQVEAAARAMSMESGAQDVDSDWHDYVATAKAALTAAVEVESLGADFQKVLHDNLWELETGKPAAAAVGDDELMARIRNAERAMKEYTIEQCARVAYEKAREYVQEVEARIIAATILAEKDK